ncbi:MAG: hypothetical protein AAGC44_10040 [Planctomycetota bacterium]
MAFTTMHFAVGMAGGGALALAGCALLRRGWRFTPLAMTLGGLWAIAPDLPRLFTEDLPSLPFAAWLGAKPLQHWLNTHGNWFFFHRLLDEQPKEFALHGLIGILVLYNLAILALIPRRLGGSPKRVQNHDGPVSQAGAGPSPTVIASIRPTDRTG